MVYPRSQTPQGQLVSKPGTLRLVILIIVCKSDIKESMVPCLLLTNLQDISNAQWIAASIRRLICYVIRSRTPSMENVTYKYHINKPGHRILLLVLVCLFSLKNIHHGQQALTPIWSKTNETFILCICYSEHTVCQAMKRRPLSQW